MDERRLGLVDGAGELELASDSPGGELDRVSVGEEGGRVRLDLREREVGGGVRCERQGGRWSFSARSET